jgi:hypothetical protein
MSWSVTVRNIKDNLEVPEPVSSFSNGPNYNIMTLPLLFGYEDRFHELGHMHQKIFLLDLIRECGKGNDGLLTDQIAVEVDEKWSNGRESRRDFDLYYNVYPDKTYEQITGDKYRNRNYETDHRFYTYLLAGYEVKFEW